MIRILAIGKKHEDWIQQGLQRYQKRLRAPWDVTWELLPHSSRQDDQARQEESRALLDRLSPSDYIILLDEVGRTLDSPALTDQLEQQFSRSRQPTIIIGGAYGVTDELRDRADLVLSLSSLVYPHQLVRLILIEQLYRAQQIAVGSSYHHE